jgi:two-component system C4-dicarboxylate transport response regulator DctD
MDMLEAELFGYEAGAFTGAKELRIGKFEYAHGGTLLLDEIESMPLAAQAKVLRVLEQKQVERLGSNRTIAIDVRIVAATKSDLRPEQAKERFRPDLYYRLAGMELQIAPLRDRGSDVLLLFDYFVRAMASRLEREPPALAPGDIEMLMQHDWPGNVRELKTVAERFALNITGSPLPGMAGFMAPAGAALPDRLAAFEKTLIALALKQSEGAVEEAAKRLGIPRRTLNEKMSRYGIGRKNLSS